MRIAGLECGRVVKTVIEGFLLGLRSPLGFMFGSVLYTPEGYGAEGLIPALWRGKYIRKAADSTIGEHPL
jgi:hypothetical protein